MITQPRPVFIVFEGLDGAGKTTCAQLTAELLGAVYITTPSPEVRCYRDELISSFRGCQEASQLFYLATVFHASRDVATMLASGRSVVLDRYYLSTEVYAEHRGTSLQLDTISSNLLPADITVFLDVPLDERRSRLAVRGCSAADRETFCESANESLRAGYFRRTRLAVVGRWLVLSVTQSAPKEVARRVVEAVFDWDLRSATAESS